MKNTGVWIDSRETKVVTIDGQRISMVSLNSGVERKPKFKGERSRKNMRGILGFDYESSQESHFQQELKRYLKSVVQLLQSSDSIYLLGPADMRKKLEKELSTGKNNTPNVLYSEPCDYLSDNQLMERVQLFFAERTKEKRPLRRRVPRLGTIA